MFPPVRSGWLSPDRNAPILPPLSGLDMRSVSHGLPERSDAVVFSLSGTPFTKDTSSTDVVRRVLESTSCAKVAYVSAHGVDGVDANAGITLMRGLYLKSTYEEKRNQEALIFSHKRATRRIWRPRVLSYAPIPLNPTAVPRWKLARDILDWCASAQEDGEVTVTSTLSSPTPWVGNASPPPW